MSSEYEAASERAGALVPVGRQPLSVGLHLVAGEDRGERARDPAGLERVRRVRAGADLTQTEVLAGFDDRAPDVLALVPRAQELEPGHARHSVVQSAHLPPADRELAQVEELDLGKRPAVRLLQNLHRGRPLNLEAVELAPARGVDGGSLVPRQLHVVAPGLGVVLNPVVRGRTPHEPNPVLLQVEEDRVSDDVPVVVAHDELLRLLRSEVLERVDADMSEELDRVRPFDLEVEHVVRLVEERGRVAPGHLLLPPVRELGRHRRIDVWSDLRVAGHLDCASDCLQLLFETP